MGTKLIIDTDPGVDDAFAIVLAGLSAEVELLGVSTVYGNVGLAAATDNARGLLALCGRDDVPVAAGADRPLAYSCERRAFTTHGSDGLSGQAGLLPEPQRALETRDAVSQLVALLESAAEPVTIAAIGPLTNIAALLAAHPDVRDKIARVVIMGGALGHGNTTAAAEFNIYSDPESARRVLAGGEVDCVLVPIDLTYRCAVDATWLDTLAASGPVGAVLEALTPDYRAHYRKALGWDGTVLHDAVAVAEAIRPGILRTEEFPVEVECSLGPARGATVVDRRSSDVRADLDGAGLVLPVRVAVDADLDALRGFVLDGLTRSR